MGAERRARDEKPNPVAVLGARAGGRTGSAAPGGPESRMITLGDGMRWRATVVARLVSQDIAAGTESARLVLRLECLTARRRSLRTALPGARSLHAVDDEALRAIIARAPARKNARSISRGGRRR